MLNVCGALLGHVRALGTFAMRRVDAEDVAQGEGIQAAAEAEGISQRRLRARMRERAESE